MRTGKNFTNRSGSSYITRGSSNTAGGWGASRTGGTRSNTTTSRGTSRTSVTGSRGGAAVSSQSWSSNSPQFNALRNQCASRIGSFRNLYSQFNGAARTNISPTIAGRWMRFINNGACVYQFNNNDFCKFFGAEWSNASTTTAFRYMRSRFGTGIKAVCRGKSNCWLVCATPTVSARPFANYTWK